MKEPLKVEITLSPQLETMLMLILEMLSKQQVKSKKLNYGDSWPTETPKND